MNPMNPVIVQGDGKVLLETRHTKFESARDFLARFAELESSPDLLHTYRITPLKQQTPKDRAETVQKVMEQ